MFQTLILQIPYPSEKLNAVFKAQTDKLTVVSYMMKLCIYSFELWSKVIIKTSQRGNKITEKVGKEFQNIL